MTSFNPTTYQALAIAKGLKLWRTTGLKPGRLWTPTAMMRTAAKITGQQYKPREYLRAEQDLCAWAQQQHEVEQHND